MTIETKTIVTKSIEAKSIVATSLALPGIRHAFFTRDGGVSGGLYSSLNGGSGSGDNADLVAENRARMAAALDVAPQCLITAFQVHSPDVVVVETPWPPQARPRADGIVTCTPGLAIGVTTADCGPILLAEPQARVIGAAHAGWRGALAGIIEATVAAMERLGAERPRVRAALGPMIRRPNYEVGPDLIARFAGTDSANQRFFRPAAREGHALFDLAGYIGMRLDRAGVSQVEDLGLCTYADPGRFFSFRRATHRGEPDYGRHVNAIVLTNAQ
jgi:polyphenol oxidase